MLKLFASGPMFGLPNPSPFVIKTLTHAKMVGLEVSILPMDFTKAPKGKIPYIERDDGTYLGDSTFIATWIEQKSGKSLYAGLSTETWALGWALEKMAEEHLYWALVYTRWMKDENFERGPRHFFDMLPDDAREAVIAEVRTKVKNNLFGQGFGRHTESEITELAAKDLKAFEALLGQKDFIGGDKPCGFDASVHAQIWGLASPLFASELGDYIRSTPALMDYIERMNARFYPEYRPFAA